MDNKQKEVVKKLEVREEYLGKLFKGFLIITLVGFLFVVPSYFELYIAFNFFFIILVCFGVFGMYVTLLQSEENSNAIILIIRSDKLK